MARKSKRQQPPQQQPDPTPAAAEASSDSSSSSSSDSAPEVAAPPAADLPAPVAPKPASPPKPTPKQPSPKKEPAPLPPSPKATREAAADPLDAMNGTIHVKVLSARNLPTMDFGRRQDPFVLVQLDDSLPKVWAATDPAFQGGTNPEWTELSNNELELFYDASQHEKGAALTFEVYSDESGDELIGTGHVDVSKVVQTQNAEPTEYPIRLKANRGEVLVHVWFGPPVRKAFRAAGRASKLLDARDAFVGMLCSLSSGACGAVSGYFQLPTDFAKKHRKLSVALAAVLGIMSAGALTVFLAIAVPTMLVAFFTFPFWIIPFLATSFFTAPLWIPILLLVGLFLLFVATFVFGLGVTSRPVRRKGAFISNKIKHSDVGKRVVYEKTQ
ncbi:FT-interacting protein 1-like [Phytophthora cinnamomi]|uniref:FT-interacting protein 1-like n=1 Tax=Phytophthora cinnamomi TaxID=4785 RepID=UPI00355A2A39|nr:FT-interacting protein 1-like [Phytophthora cinnamomi]